MKLRDYQQAAVDAVLETWRTHRSCVVILPTGCGKTVVFAEVIRRVLHGQPPADQPAGRRAMVLAHREELVNQAAEKIKALAGADVGVEMGELVAEGETLLVLEAMKMENEVTADRSGTVTGIIAAKGQTVETGDPLVVIS